MTAKDKEEINKTRDYLESQFKNKYLDQIYEVQAKLDSEQMEDSKAIGQRVAEMTIELQQSRRMDDPEGIKLQHDVTVVNEVIDSLEIQTLMEQFEEEYEFDIRPDIVAISINELRGLKKINEELQRIKRRESFAKYYDKFSETESANNTKYRLIQASKQA